MKNFADACGAVRKKRQIRLIIVSTWRAGIAKGSESNPDSIGIKNLKEAFARAGLQIDDATPLTENKSRQEEIDYYIRRNGVKDYVVIDDDLSLYDNPSGLPLISPDYRIGFTKQNVKELMRYARR